VKPPKRPLNIAEAAWLEAVRREVVVRPVALADSPSGLPFRLRPMRLSSAERTSTG
jgi:hypothetical protein